MCDTRRSARCASGWQARSRPQRRHRGHCAPPAQSPCNAVPPRCRLRHLPTSPQGVACARPRCRPCRRCRCRALTRCPQLRSPPGVRRHDAARRPCPCRRRLCRRQRWA
eukprot:351732-Chlamydomonas_euryale.AAC.6